MKRKLFLGLVSMIWMAGIAQTPTMPATGITFTDVLCNRVTVSWNSGDGARRMVVAREEQEIDSIPKNNTYYIANSTFGTPSAAMTTGHYVVYNGTGNSVIVSGLNQNTTYYFAVFEFNGTSPPINYLTNPYEQDSVKTQSLNVDFVEVNSEYHQCENVNGFTFSPTVTQTVTPKQDINFLWNFGDGNTSTDSVASHAYNRYGKFAVKLTVITSGCQSSVTRFDTVAPLPLVDFTLPPDTPNNEQVQCFFNRDGSQNRFFFKNTTINPAIIGLSTDQADINWYYGDGTTSKQYNGRKTYSQPGTYRVLLVVRTTKTNNKQIYCVDSVFDYVTVKPRPLNPDSVWFSDTFMCEKGNRFFFENKEPVAADSIIWYFGEFGMKDDTKKNAVSHSYLEYKDGKTRKYQVNLVYIDTAGCYDEFSDSVRVIGQPDNYFTGLDSPYCQFDPVVTLTPNLNGGIFFGDYVTPGGKYDPRNIGIHTINYVVEENKCTDTFTRMTQVLPRPIFSLGSDTSICEGSIFQLSVVKNGNSALWQDNSTDSFFNISAEGLYWLQLDNGNCSFRDSIAITVVAPPNITLGNDSTLCGDGYRSVDITTDEGTYVWNDGYTEAQRLIDKTGYYEVLVYNKCGRDSAAVDLVILPFPCDIYVPTAFSPNGDYLNNTFRPIGNVNIISMEIYNRWGERLYYTNDPKPEWDGYYLGELVQQGTYFFIITYQLPTGEYTIPTVVSGPLTVVY